MLHIPYEPHDWILMSYSLGEINPNGIEPLLNTCWKQANKGMILIEPGTPRGYHTLMRARNLLILLGGSIQAPCPHSRSCPLRAGDWCHFSTRATHLHRLAKHATLPYEDEKFSYLILSKEATPHSNRIIRSPLHRSGHTLLPLCTPDGLETVTVPRSDKEHYKTARKAKWGDTW